MKIRTLSRRDVPDVVTLHTENLPGLSTFLGKQYLVNLYSRVISTQSAHLHFGAFINRRLAGFAIASTNPPLSFAIMHPHLSAGLMVTLITLMLRGDITLTQLWQRRRFEKIVRSHVLADHGYILVVAVGQKFRRRHIAVTLLETLIKRTGRTIIWVDTRIENTAALSLYRKTGFTQTVAAAGAVLLSYKRP